VAPSDRPTSQTTVILGKEYDRDLHAALLDVLHILGGVVVDQPRGVGGSQEVATLYVDRDGHTVTVTSETYIGLSINADRDIAERIVELLGQRGCLDS
jgi:hypothetical protein